VLLAGRTVELLKDPPVELVERAGVELRGKRATVAVYGVLRQPARPAV
jgi:class 3 adenylate cyclase